METQGEIERSGLLPPCTSSVPKARFSLKTVIPRKFFLHLASGCVLLGGGEQIRSINKQKEKVHCKLMCLTWGRCIGGRTSLKGTFFPIQASGLRQIRVARGSKMGAVCGIRGAAAVHAQSFKKKENIGRRVARQVL